MKWNSALALAASFTVPAHAAFLHPISSTYVDESTHERLDTNGTAFTFAYQEKDSGPFRYFALTAAHVSQGENAVIHDFAGKVLGRLANNVADIEILELDRSPFAEKPSAMWNSTGKAISVMPEGLHEIKPGNLFKIEKKYTSAMVIQASWVETKLPLGYLQTDPDSQLFSSQDDDLGNGLVYLPLTQELYAKSYLAQGMSGTPLISFMAPGGDLMNLTMQVIGIGLRSQRDLPGSWYAPKMQIASLLESYLAGKRGAYATAQWKVRSRLSYREFADGETEIPFLRESTGNLTRSDGGSLTKADTGNLTRSDGGGLSQTNGASLGTKAEQGGELRTDLWREAGIQPGVKWKGDSATIAYRIPGIGVLYAEDSAALISENLKVPVEGFQAVPIETDYTALFVEKFSKYMAAQADLLRSSQRNQQGSKCLSI